MKVLLVNAPMLYVESLTRATSSTHLQLIYSYLKAHGVEVDVFDASVELDVPKGDVPTYLTKIAQCLDGRTFDLAGISCWTSYHYLGAMEVGRLLRASNPTAPLVVGGWHAMVLPTDFMAPDSPFDWIVQGPGEQVLLDMCNNLERPSTPSCIQAAPVPLDSIPIDWTYPYRRSTVILSRGCPYSCMYCTERSTWSDCASLDLAVETYASAAEYGRNTNDPLNDAYSIDNFVHVQDACFGLNKNWRRAFLRQIAELPSQVRLDVEARIDQLEPEDLELLGAVRATIYFGIESGSPEMLRIMRKTKNPEHYLKCCREVLSACDQYGVEYYVGVLYNHPGETKETLQQSIDFCWRLLWDGPSKNLLDFFIHQYAYLPGSPLDAQLADFSHRYGTQIHHPGWWRTPEMEHRSKAEANTASWDLSLKDAEEMAQRFRLMNWLNRNRQSAADSQ